MEQDDGFLQFAEKIACTSFKAVSEGFFNQTFFATSKKISIRCFFTMKTRVLRDNRRLHGYVQKGSKRARTRQMRRADRFLQFAKKNACRSFKAVSEGLFNDFADRMSLGLSARYEYLRILKLVYEAEEEPFVLQELYREARQKKIISMKKKN